MGGWERGGVGGGEGGQPEVGYHIAGKFDRRKFGKMTSFEHLISHRNRHSPQDKQRQLLAVL